MVSITLKVREPYEHQFRSSARVGYDSMDLINGHTGDTVQIKLGRKKTVARLHPLFSDDEGEIVRINPILKSNIGARVGQMVEITKLNTIAAKQIELKPIEQMRNVNTSYFSAVLEQTPIIKDDTIEIPYYGRIIRFRVKGVRPTLNSNSAAMITDETLFHVL